MGVYSDRIRTKLTQAFQPVRLAVTDDSARHHGHAGADVEGGETHFNVEIAAAAFAGKSRVDRQRMIHAVLTDELNERVHALSLKVSDA